MPGHDLPPELKPVVDGFIESQRRFSRARNGAATLKAVSSFSSAAVEGFGSARPAGATLPSAEPVISWLSRFPTKVARHKKAPLADLEGLPFDEAWDVVQSGLTTLSVAINAMLSSPVPPRKTFGAEVLHVAFGADEASTLLRNGLSRNRLPLPMPPKRQFGDIGKLVRAGTLRDLIQTFARCGATAVQERQWAAQATALGEVSALKPPRACAGDRLTIEFKGFGATMPPGIGDIMISLPRRGGGCSHVSLRSIDPTFLTSAGWRDSGTITLELPDDIFEGWVGFFTVPPPIQSTGCPAGGLIAAAGMLQSVLGDAFGGSGVLVAQSIVALAVQADSSWHASLPCAGRQRGNKNHLEAGPPVISLFQAVESGFVHPRGFVTLRWSVANADHIEIVPRTAPGSLNAHELPPIAGPLRATGTLKVSILPTRRWEGEYVLRATNANGCSPAPAEAVVALTSGFSAYLVGAAKVDITDARPGLPMLGFSDEAQKSSGRIDLPQYARTFVIAENRPDAAFLAIVVCDFWGCSEILKAAVLERLNARSGRRPYSEATLIIGATHTHAGPGCYFEYFMYNMASGPDGGFDQRLFDSLVEGVVFSVVQAEARMAPTRIYVNAGELADCGANRSWEAYARNVDAVTGDPTQWTDREMLLLKFVRDLDNRGGTQPTGALNWYAIHPTGLGMFNDLISGDSKGWAAERFEAAMRATAPGFIAAFGNAAAGDVSANLTLSGQGVKSVVMPLARPDNPLAVAGEKARMMTTAQQQFEKALALFDGAIEEVAGPIAMQHMHVDMSSVSISGTPGARTWPAAMGVSFGAGSSEDSLARTSLAGMMIESHIMEGFTTATRVLGVVEAGALLVLPIAATLLPAVLGAPAVIVTSPGAIVGTAAAAAAAAGAVTIVPPEVLGSLLNTSMNLLPAHGCAYITSTLATAMFAGRVVAPAETANETWSWEVPGPFEWPADFAPGHGAKPIMFAPGLTVLIRTPKDGSPPERIACPLVPHVLPLQLIRIGQVALAGVPAEFTATAGRRLKAAVRAALGPSITRAAIFGYANSYSGYVTTPEEYEAQHYEGASTLYGPHTLAAYIQRFEALVANMIAGLPEQPSGRFKVPAIHHKP